MINAQYLQDLALLSANGWRPLDADDGYDYSAESEFGLEILNTSKFDAIRWQDASGGLHLEIFSKTETDSGFPVVRCYTIKNEQY